MIRSVFAYLNAALATTFFGSLVIVAGMFGVRGRFHSRMSSHWARALLWGSKSGVRAHGVERIDWSRPHVLVANHTGSFEILAIAVTMPGTYHFVAKKELERVPVFGPAWKRAGHISIDRSNRQKAMESLRTAAELMHRHNGIVIIFPEGTRSLDGALQPFKKGAFQLAIEAQVPVIPVIVTGSDRIVKPGRLRITPGVMDLHIGDEVPVDGFAPDRVDELIEIVHARMRGMLADARGRELTSAVDRQLSA